MPWCPRPTPTTWTGLSVCRTLLNSLQQHNNLQPSLTITPHLELLLLCFLFSWFIWRSLVSSSSSSLLTSVRHIALYRPLISQVCNVLQMQTYFCMFSDHNEPQCDVWIIFLDQIFVLNVRMAGRGLALIINLFCFVTGDPPLDRAWIIRIMTYYTAVRTHSCLM